MGGRQETALDRFIENRGGSMLGFSGTRLASLLSARSGSVFVLGGLVMLLAAAADSSPKLLGLAVAFVFAGLFNLAMGGFFRSKAKMPKSTVQLSAEAKSLLSSLLREKYGWMYSWSGYDPAEMDAWGALGRGKPSMGIWVIGSGVPQVRTSKEAVEAPVRDLLEAAATQYNRVFGCVASARAASQSSINKMEGNIAKAADEAMAEILHNAALMAEFPESSEAAKRLIETRTASLDELATRLESIQLREPSFVEKLSTTNSMDTVLEDLRLEQLARTELAAEETPQQTQNLL